MVEEFYLWRSRSYPNAIIDRIGKDAFENITLSVDLSSVDFVKQSHHDKCVENNGEMLGGFGAEWLATSRIDIEKFLTYNKANKNT